MVWTKYNNPHKRKRKYKPMDNNEMMERACLLSIMDKRLGYDIPPEHYYKVLKERNEKRNG